MSPATRKSKRAATAAAAKQDEPDLLAEAQERAPKKQKEDPEPEHASTLHAHTEQKHANIDAGPDVAPSTDIEHQIAEVNEGEAEEKDLAVGDTGEQEEGDDKEEVDEAEPEHASTLHAHTEQKHANIDAGPDVAPSTDIEHPEPEHASTLHAHTEQKHANIDAGPDVAPSTDIEHQIAEVNEGEAEEKDLAVEDTGEQEEGDDKEEVDEAEEVDEDCERIQLDVEGDTGDDGIGDDEDVEEPGNTQEPEKKQGDDATAAAQNNGTKTATSSKREDEAFPSQGKIFIGGLTWETTADTLQNHFGKYGEITDSVVMKNRNTGHPRGFGFVTFADPSVCDKVLKDTHVIDGRTVEAKQTVPREKGLASSKGPKSKKIFVGGLTTATTEEELKVYFEKFGKVVEHQIMQDHKTGRSRGFGFVTFDSEEVVDNILSQGRLLELGGKQVEVKIAEPKRAGQESFAGSSNNSRPFASRGGSFRGGHGAYDTYFTRGGGHNRRGRPGGPSFGDDAYRYGGGYSGFYAYGGLDDGYVGLGLNYPSFGSGPGYGYNYGGSYGSNPRGYGGNGGRYHPYGR